MYLIKDFSCWSGFVGFVLGMTGFSFAAISFIEGGMVTIKLLSNLTDINVIVR